MVTVPGWNPDDKTGKATAAFESQARVPSWYDTGRWQMNPGSPLYQQFAQEQVKKILALQPAGTGVFFDNVADYPHAAAWMGSGVVEFGGASLTKPQLVSDYTAGMARFLGAVKTALPPGAKLIINDSGDPFSDQAGSPNAKNLPLTQLLPDIDGTWFEMSVGYKQSQSMTASYMTQYRNLVNSYCSRGKTFVIDADPDQFAQAAPQLAKASPPERNQLYVLAFYYLASESCTAFDYERNASGYSAPWRDWFEAIDYPIGKAKGEATVLAANDAPKGPVFSRTFEKGLVLLRPASAGSGTETIDLKGSYRLLHGNGTVDPMTIRRIDLQAYQAVILIPAQILTK
jgi:hypothetical protein